MLGAFRAEVQSRPGQDPSGGDVALGGLLYLYSWCQHRPLSPPRCVTLAGGSAPRGRRLPRAHKHGYVALV